jgi:5'-deoxynucleotidase YfbR-like HD superfamily hydrolase
MTDQPDFPTDLASEFRRLGENLKEALRAGWDSEERRRLESEIETGLDAAATAIRGAARELSESPTGQRLRAELHDLGERARSGEMESRVRQDIVSALQAINRELEQAAATWKRGRSEPPGPES